MKTSLMYGISERVYEVELLDDGSLDTVVSIDGIVHHCTGEFSQAIRDADGVMTEDGLLELAEWILETDERHW